MAFNCQVCFEERDKRFALPELKTGNGDLLRAKDCEHPICQTCLATFVATRVNEQFVFHIRCPFTDCVNEIFEQDVKRLATVGALTQDISERFAELRARDYTARAESLSETLASLEKGDDYSLIVKLWETTRLCPRCSLVIEKSQGCNSFYCICGHHFHWDSAPRIVGKGIKNYGQVVSIARSHGLSLQDVQQYGGSSWRKARALAWNSHVKRTAGETRLSRDEAWELLQKARLGDKSAREVIRSARNREETSEENDADWEEHPDLWVNNTEGAERSHKELQQESDANIRIEAADKVFPEVAATTKRHISVNLQIDADIRAMIPECFEFVNELNASF